jgi:hypothetical protein
MGTDVALGLPPYSQSVRGYTRQQTELVRELLEERGYSDVVEIRWPPAFTMATLSLLHRSDWAIIDVAETGLAAYLHGAFVPTMRLARLPSRQPLDTLPMGRLLYGGIDVGYVTDVVRWNEGADLEEGLRQRLATLAAPAKRIGTLQEAENYFLSAALRKETVFLSYSGRNDVEGREVSAALRQKFQTVFDYRDGRSIRPGEPWMAQIFDQLSSSALGVVLLSKDYLESGNCVHEAREMMALRDAGKMKLIPVKLTRDSYDVPSFLRDIQYMRSWEHPDLTSMVDVIVQTFGPDTAPS